MTVSYRFFWETTREGPRNRHGIDADRKIVAGTACASSEHVEGAGSAALETRQRSASLDRNRVRS